MIDGGFCESGRTEDHRIIEPLIQSNRYDSSFWNDVFDTLNVVMIVPEDHVYTFPGGMSLTSQQLAKISDLDRLGFEYNEFC